MALLLAAVGECNLPTLAVAATELCPGVALRLLRALGIGRVIEQQTAVGIDTGMMGCAGKNDTVRDICLERGMTEEQWEAIKRPIGLKFGAKTPAELAIAIVAELIDVRYRQRYSKEARDRHDKSIGR